MFDFVYKIGRARAVPEHFRFFFVYIHCKGKILILKNWIYQTIIVFLLKQNNDDFMDSIIIWQFLNQFFLTILH